MKLTVLTAAAAVFWVGPAFADVAAVATTDLNVRGGPGTEYPVVGFLKSGEAVALQGCLDGSKWCVLGDSGGWVYSDYLSSDVGGTAVIVTDRPGRLEVPTVVYDGPPSAVPAAVGGAIAGAVIAGPVGAVVGGIAGATLGAAVDPPEPVRTFVTGNPVDPVYLDGEVVVGATLPEGVTFTPVPDYQYSYAYVNGVPVLVEPKKREIVYIVR